MLSNKKNNLVFVDCEAGPCIGKGDLTEFGAVHYCSMETFYGNLKNKSKKEKRNIFLEFERWLKKNCQGHKPVFVSDNPAFDWQWINYYFHHLLGYNPFGWSARRIGDYYAGLERDFFETQKWKKFRVTKHDHNPVNDAMGNVEAFKRIETKRILKK